MRWLVLFVVACSPLSLASQDASTDGPIVGGPLDARDAPPDAELAARGSCSYRVALERARFRIDVIATFHCPQEVVVSSLHVEDIDGALVGFHDVGVSCHDGVTTWSEHTEAWSSEPVLTVGYTTIMDAGTNVRVRCTEAGR